MKAPLKSVANSREPVLPTPSSFESEETLLAGMPQGLQQIQMSNMDEKNVHAVDLGLSVLWADCNVGGTTDAPTGELYGWGDASGLKTSQNVNDYLDYKGGLYLSTPKDISGTMYDIASQKMGLCRLLVQNMKIQRHASFVLLKMALPDLSDNPELYLWM